MFGYHCVLSAFSFHDKHCHVLSVSGVVHYNTDHDNCCNYSLTFSLKWPSFDGHHTSGQVHKGSSFRSCCSLAQAFLPANFSSRRHQTVSTALKKCSPLLICCRHINQSLQTQYREQLVYILFRIVEWIRINDKLRVWNDLQPDTRPTQLQQHFISLSSFLFHIIAVFMSSRANLYYNLQLKTFDWSVIIF